MEGLAEAARLVGAARRGVAFTGAGVSAESGIQTFRGQDGLWKHYDPVRTATLSYFLQDPAYYWQVSKERWHTYREARPNPGPLALADLEAGGPPAPGGAQKNPRRAPGGGRPPP